MTRSCCRPSTLEPTGTYLYERDTLSMGDRGVALGCSKARSDHISPTRVVDAATLIKNLTC